MALNWEVLFGRECAPGIEYFFHQIFGEEDACQLYLLHFIAGLILVDDVVAVRRAPALVHFLRNRLVGLSLSGPFVVVLAPLLNQHWRKSVLLRFFLVAEHETAFVGLFFALHSEGSSGL